MARSKRKEGKTPFARGVYIFLITRKIRAFPVPTSVSVFGVFGGAGNVRRPLKRGVGSARTSGVFVQDPTPHIEDQISFFLMSTTATRAIANVAMDRTRAAMAISSTDPESLSSTTIFESSSMGS